MKFKYEDFKNNLEKIEGEFIGLVEKKEVVDGKEVTIYFYIISYNELFDNDIRREMRGITFIDKDTYFLSLHKFFNINQHEETQYGKLKDKKIIEITDKLDGSLINPIVINGKIYMKSKASIISEQSVGATDFVNGNSVYKTWIEGMIEKRLHPIFEWVAPDNRIVLRYEKSDLVLLQIRDDEGNYLNINDFDIPEGITIRKEYDLEEWGSLEKLYKYIREAKDLEGVVIRFEDGQMVKLKSEWYFEKHRYTNLTDKDYMTHILNDTIDDILSIEQVDHDLVMSYIYKVNKYITKKAEEITKFDFTGFETVKDVAIGCAKDPNRGMLITYFKNRDIEEVFNLVKKRMKQDYNKLSACVDFFTNEEV